MKYLLIIALLWAFNVNAQISVKTVNQKSGTTAAVINNYYYSDSVIVITDSTRKKTKKPRKHYKGDIKKYNW